MQLKGCETGCMLVISLNNHLMYTDLVIFGPCSAGLQQLLRVGSHYGIDMDTKYNTDKSNIVVVRSRKEKNEYFLISSCLALPIKCGMRLNIWVITELMNR